MSEQDLLAHLHQLGYRQAPVGTGVHDAVLPTWCTLQRWEAAGTYEDCPRVVSAAKIPTLRTDLGGGGAKAWSLGYMFRPLPSGRLSVCEYLVGVAGIPHCPQVKPFGPRYGRAFRWFLRASDRRLFAVDKIWYPDWLLHGRDFP